MMRGRLLGIDHGLKRIGLAVCDASWLVAREVTILTRRSKREDFAEINRIAAEQEVVGFVVGLPSDLDAPQEMHTQADTVRIWADRFKETTSLPVILWDETLSSEDAKAIARNLRRKPDEPVDDLAARVILQSYLDAVKAGLVVPPENGEHSESS